MPDKSRPARTPAEGTGSTAAGTTAETTTVAAAPRRSPGPQVRPKNGLDRYFEVTARRSTVGREVRGGLTTFFTMAYIVVLNPIILSGA
ncbi:MAG: Xanthine/uracil/vitamin permease, partial [Mycetocola sp.]|nr:Xanthine/uracil/vitamin permease [Mycetocola sp.]